MNKIAIVSTILPETNYSAFLIKATQKHKEVLVYTDKNKKNLEVGLKNVSLVWHKNPLYVLEILFKSLRDRIDTIHLQFEINMYGGAIPAFIFPMLLFLLRFFKIKTIVTLHAVVPVDMIDSQFLDTFGYKKFKIISPIVKLCFFLLYKGIGLFSDIIIVHSVSLKNTFRFDYHCKKEIYVISHGVPDVGIDNDSTLPDYIAQHIKDKKIILFFGYLVRRKGLNKLIEAFEIIADEFKDYILILAGGTLQPDYVKELKLLTFKKGLEKRIIFTSFVNIDILGSLLKKAEFLVLPSLYSISASGPFALAIASHKAVIATNTGVFAGEITNRETGLLCRPRDAYSLYENMKELIINDWRLLNIEMAIILMHIYRKWSKVALEHIKLYEKK